ncbi:MAG TPA: hypothetical protein VE869_03075 [Gemmatimonas sp.]|nr:hypothetical protein [Gemmatimonas sp.]
MGSELQRAVAAETGCPVTSVFPSDHCYNLINRSLRSFNRWIFVHLGRNQYRYLGEPVPGEVAPYDGEILWRPISEPARVVGRWVNGRPMLQIDPRDAKKMNARSTA